MASVVIQRLRQSVLKVSLGHLLLKHRRNFTLLRLRYLWLATSRKRICFNLVLILIINQRWLAEQLVVLDQTDRDRIALSLQRLTLIDVIMKLLRFVLRLWPLGKRACSEATWQRADRVCWNRRALTHMILGNSAS